jgi:hypothetical protein
MDIPTALPRLFELHHRVQPVLSGVGGSLLNTRGETRISPGFDEDERWLTMIGIAGTLGDRLLHALVPKLRAEAGCITDPYDYLQFCNCSPTGFKRYRICHVYSNCTTQCNKFCSVPGNKC